MKLLVLSDGRTWNGYMDMLRKVAWVWALREETDYVSSIEAADERLKKLMMNEQDKRSAQVSFPIPVQSCRTSTSPSRMSGIWRKRK